MHRRFREVAEPSGVDPQSARIADIGGMEVQRGSVGDDLRERARRRHEERERESDSFKVRKVRPSSHYGSTATVVRVTWITGTATPCTGSRTVRVVESWNSPPR